MASTLLATTPTLGDSPKQKKKANSRKRKAKKELAKEEVVKIDPEEIHFTQKWIHDQFTDGDKILDIIYDILRGATTFKDSFGPVKIAKKAKGANEGEYYAIDNRRLFIAKALKMYNIPCIVEEWKGNYDTVLKSQNTIPIKKHQKLKVAEIEKFVWGELRDFLFKKAEDREDENMIYAPRECIRFLKGAKNPTTGGLDPGWVRRQQQYRYGVKIAYFKENFTEYGRFDFIPIFVIEDKKAKNESRPEKAVAHLKKMINTYYDREGGQKEDFFEDEIHDSRIYESD